MTILVFLSITHFTPQRGFWQLGSKDINGYFIFSLFAVIFNSAELKYEKTNINMPRHMDKKYTLSQISTEIQGRGAAWP